MAGISNGNFEEDILKITSIFRIKKKLLSLILALTAALGAFGSYTKLVYALGRLNKSEMTAIELQKLFDFQAEIEEGEIDLADKIINLQNIYLARYFIPVEQNKEVYIVRKIVNRPTITVEVGSITTNREIIEQDEHLKDFWESIQKIVSFTSSNFGLIEKAYAQQLFQWHSYENNYDFREEYIDRFTIRRYYDDGAILEYKVDDEGTSIPETFKWIKLPQ
jgi:hypothetical protein